MIEDLIVFTIATLMGLLCGALCWGNTVDAAQKRERRRVARLIHHKYPPTF